ncbi:hypothetical protein JCM10207_000744 [Rhodosporidiobolus poonsookiae]
MPRDRHSNSSFIDPPVCEDLLLSILEELPTRELVKKRKVSRQFAILVDEIIRTRFLDLAHDEDNEIILESCAPYETRATHRQPISFSHFGPATDLPYTGNVAHFSLPANPPIAQFLPLDDGEMFAQNILSVQIRNAPRRPSKSSDDPADGEEAIIEVASPPVPPAAPFYDYSLSLASSLDRLFRDFFESPSPTPSPPASRAPSPPPFDTPSSSPSSSPSRPTRSHRLACPYNPLSPSALFSAQIECYQVVSDRAGGESSDSDGDSVMAYSCSPTPGRRFGRECATPPRLFEYYFSAVEMDVGKVVCAAEEGLPRRAKSRVARPAANDSVFIMF